MAGDLLHFALQSPPFAQVTPFDTSFEQDKNKHKKI